MSEQTATTSTTETTPETHWKGGVEGEKGTRGREGSTGINPVLVDCVNQLGERVETIVNGVKVTMESPPLCPVKQLTPAEKAKIKNKKQARKSKIRDLKQSLTAMNAVIDGVQASTKFQSSLKPEIRAIMSCDRWVTFSQVAKAAFTIILSEQTTWLKDIPPDCIVEIVNVKEKVDELIDEFTESMTEISELMQNSLAQK